MAIQLAAAITSFVIAFLIVPIIIKYSLKRNILDIPGRRKIHKKVTPSMGGIAIFCGFFISSLIWINFGMWSEIKFILVALFVIFFIGVRDDLVPLRAILKLIGQILAASLLIFLFDLRLHSFYGILGIYDLPDAVSYLLTIFTIIIITNSFNLIDGLDGLAGTIAIIALFLAGAAIAALSVPSNVVMLSTSLLALALWLLRHDIAQLLAHTRLGCHTTGVLALA